MGDHNWETWWSKLGKGVTLASGSAACLYAADYIIDNPLPPEYALWGGLAIVLLQQIGNYIKHNYLV